MFRLPVLIFLLLVSAAEVQGAGEAAEPATADRAGDRPRIGLVLGGGGAKGASHIGVLQVLDELGVPIDCVAGTSMGALVGATFASGRTGNDIADMLRGIDWQQTVGGMGLRREQPIENKVSGRASTEGFEFGLNRDGFRMPGGLIPSQQIESVIRSLIGGARNASSFDELPIPFRAIATDLITADTVVMDSGDLSVAMRASMAAPGAFSPVVIDGRVLADGGLTRNIPIDVARELCADVVIAVWNEVPPLAPDDLDTALSLVDRSINVMIIANELAQIRTLGEADIGIPVKTGDIGAGDFLRAGEAIELGRRYALEHADALRRYALPREDYLAWRRSLETPPGDNFVVVDEVVINGAERVNPAFIRASLKNVNRAGPLSREMIVSDIRRVFAQGDFERVDYTLSGSGRERRLDLDVREKSWGPNFLRLDFGVATTGDDDLRALIRAEHTRTWLNRFGGRWQNTAQIGQRSLVNSRFYQPLDVGQNVFIELAAGFQNTLEDIYTGRDRTARYDFDEWSTSLDAGINIDTRAQLRLGITSGTTSADIDTGPPELPELSSTSYAELRVRGIYDTRNEIRLPTRGSYASIAYRHADSGLGGDLDYEIVEGVITRAFALGGNSLSLIVGGGERLSGELPLTRQFQLGGIRTFPGLRPGELRGERFWFSGASYAWRLASIQPLFGQDLYGGLQLSAGDMSRQLDGSDDGTVYSLSGSLSARTPLGVFLLALSWVDNDRLSLQFSLGRPLEEGSLLDVIY